MIRVEHVQIFTLEKLKIEKALQRLSQTIISFLRQF